MARERSGCRLTDVTNAERIQEASERRVFAVLECVDELHGGLLAHALQVRELLRRELVKVSRTIHELRLDELIDDLRAETFDVQRAATCKVPQRLFALCRAKQSARATCDRLVL